MKRRHPPLVSDNSGVSAVEFAIVAPVLFTLMFGIWNAGIVLFAQNGVRNAVESGARHATIFPRPTEQQIKKVVTDRYYGPSQGKIEEPKLTYSLQNNSPIVTISMSYTHEASLPFLKLPPLVLEHRRTAYLAPIKGPES
jgi:hypothetical protein